MRWDPDLTPAVIVAATSLAFTVASFWFLQARRGRIKSYECHSFAIEVKQDYTVIRLPVVLYNNGAVPIVVQNLRLTFPEEPDGTGPLLWRSTRSQLKPDLSDGHQFPAVFGVPGRTAQQLFVDFSGQWPGLVPEPRSYLVRVQAKVAHRRAWQTLAEFALRADHIVAPTQWITYSNTDDPLTAGEDAKAKARAALGALRQTRTARGPRQEDGADIDDCQPPAV